LKINVTSGSFTVSDKLLTISHDSTRDLGEVFNRDIRDEAQNYPMFLVRGNNTSDMASITFELQGSDQTESSIAGTAVSAVIAATKFIAAPPALLTTLSAPTNKDVATSIDNTINKLFSMTLDEQQILDQPIRTWQPITLKLRLPIRQGGWADLKNPPGGDGTVKEKDLRYMDVGTWTVEFEAPHVSAFSTAIVKCPALDAKSTVSAPANGSGVSRDQECLSAYDAATVLAQKDVAARQYADVLTLPLTTGGGVTGTLGSYLKQQDWWTNDVKALDAPSGAAAADAKADQKAGATTSDGANQFCRQVRDAMTGIGFNAFDGYVAIEAIEHSTLVTAAESRVLVPSQECTMPTEYSPTSKQEIATAAQQGVPKAK
jgi:hypothetical protein